VTIANVIQPDHLTYMHQNGEYIKSRAACTIESLYASKQCKAATQDNIDKKTRLIRATGQNELQGRFTVKRQLSVKPIVFSTLEMALIQDDKIDRQCRSRIDSVKEMR
jgi:hypothetical protein